MHEAATPQPVQSAKAAAVPSSSGAPLRSAKQAAATPAAEPSAVSAKSAVKSGRASGEQLKESPVRKRDSSPGAKTEQEKPGQVERYEASPRLPVDAETLRPEIERLAYALWEERGRPYGSSDEDWHRAVEDIRQRYAMRS